jgi:hypothetical protein
MNLQTPKEILDEYSEYSNSSLDATLDIYAAKEEKIGQLCYIAYMDKTRCQYISQLAWKGGEEFRAVWKKYCIDGDTPLLLLNKKNNDPIAYFVPFNQLSILPKNIRKELHIENGVAGFIPTWFLSNNEKFYLFDNDLYLTECNNGPIKVSPFLTFDKEITPTGCMKIICYLAGQRLSHAFLRNHKSDPEYITIAFKLPTSKNKAQEIGANYWTHCGEWNTVGCKRHFTMDEGQEAIEFIQNTFIECVKSGKHPQNKFSISEAAYSALYGTFCPEPEVIESPFSKYM